MDVAGSVKKTLKEWDRVIKLSRKPRRDEYNNIAKITGIGIIVIGLIGFFIRMAVQVLVVYF